MPTKKGGYIATGMTEKQIRKAANEEIKVKNNDSLLIYKKKGYTVNDRNILFNKYIKNRTQKPFSHTPGKKKLNDKITYKIELPKVDLDNIITNINGGCTRLGYY
jgi:hypothetical protein